MTATIRPVAALFVQLDSIYKTLPGVDCYDEERDALMFPGGMPVVAHPPCRLWGKLRFFSKAPPEEKELAIWAVDQVRRWGGVLEHPQGSQLWAEKSLPEPGAGRDEYAGWTLVVDQFWWGHKARKRTRLYICGCAQKDMPAMSFRMGQATHTVGLYSGRNKKTCRPEIPKAERSATPPAFAAWLVEVARRTQTEAPR